MLGSAQRQVSHLETDQHKQSKFALTLLALGVVYGDIGTSPLYAVKETFNPSHGIPITPENVLGGISAILWALMIVVTLKYVILIMRAHNNGEGGIMALLALAQASVGKHARYRTALVMVGLFGAALFVGEAVLTPAISVLSAVEGLEVGTSALKPVVVPIAIGIIVALFAFQRHGSAVIGRLFGPICVAWFLSISAAGVYGIVMNPEILYALNPMHALLFVTQHGFASFVVLGAVLLCFTGAEALYADMGHFGKEPIRFAWFGLVFPALALNYLGQGAELIANPKSIENPFYLLFPEWALYPMVALATAATVIASQATITGAYSLTKQAIQLGFLPRMVIQQTSAREIGQIYLPAVNWILLVLVMGAVLGFGSSTNLASAYGVAVTGTMVVATFLTFFVIRFGWGYNLALCLFATGFFLVVDVAFFASSILKVPQGGWFPLVLGLCMFLLMTTWRRGRQILMERLQTSAIPLNAFLASLFDHPLQRVGGTAVFMVSNVDAVPHAMLHNLSHNKVLHERVVFLHVKILEVPWVPFTERVTVKPMGNGCWNVLVKFGFKNVTDVPKALELASAQGLHFEMMETSFFLNRETIISTPDGGMVQWRERMFATMARNASSAVDYFKIPTNRVVELGTQIEI
jgi:KUP system potassium uptake protein